jgi:hypothetical protein
MDIGGQGSYRCTGLDIGGQDSYRQTVMDIGGQDSTGGQGWTKAAREKQGPGPTKSAYNRHRQPGLGKGPEICRQNRPLPDGCRCGLTLQTQTNKVDHLTGGWKYLVPSDNFFLYSVNGDFFNYVSIHNLAFL